MEHPAIKSLDASYRRKLKHMAKMYNTTELMILYGLIDKQYEILTGEKLKKRGKYIPVLY